MSNVYAAMIAWIKLVTGLKVIRENDPESSAPRPNADGSVDTYVSIQFDRSSSTSSTAYEENVYTEATDQTDQERSHVREATLAVEIFGPGAEDYCFAIELSRGRRDVIDLLATYGDISIQDIGDISDDPVIRSASREPDASMAVGVQFVYEETVTDVDTVANVETVIDFEER